MITAASLFLGVLLFLVGLKLSAFFSGSETGFYRLSTLQLTLQAQRGDPIARRLQYFVLNPERFVTTALVGNNVANYLTTVAIGVVVATVLTSYSGTAEIVATVLVTPVVFIFGELIPKSLFYRAPMMLLRRGSVWFTVFFYLFLPISYPLILISRLVSHLGSRESRPLQLVFGRTRLFSLLAAGHREGLLTRLQNQLAENMLHVAAQPVEHTMIPAALLHGTVESVSREELFQLSQRVRTSYVMIHPDDQPRQWTHYVRIADVLATRQTPRLVMRRLPVFEPATPRLEVLTELFRHNAPYGAVVENERVIGLVSRQTLVSQLFRVVGAPSAQVATGS